MKTKVLRFVLAAAAAFGLMTTDVAMAVPITSNPTITSGGLVFDTFTCSISQGGLFSDPDRCGQINVSQNTGPGIGLDISSGFVAALGSFDDAFLTYHVHANGGLISGIELDFDGTFFGLAVASVTETVKDALGNIVGLLTVSCSPLGCDRQDPSYEGYDIPLSGMYSDLYVKKDILVAASLGLAQTSYIHQGYTTVPEPGTLALLGLGFLGIGGAARRRSKSAA